MDVNTTNAAGTLRISQDVIATIATTTTTEIDGVAGMAPFASGLTSGWIWRAKSSRPVIVDLHDGIAGIDIHVNLVYGTRIPEVSSKIQQAVKDAVQNMTGVAVTKVNVYIAGVVFENTVSEA